MRRQLRKAFGVRTPTLRRLLRGGGASGLRRIHRTPRGSPSGTGVAVTNAAFMEAVRVMIVIGFALSLLMFAGLLVAGAMSFLGYETPW